MLIKIILGTTTEGAFLENVSTWERGVNMGLYNDNQTIVRINLLLRPFNFGYYYVNSLFYVVMSTFGGIFLYKSFSRVLPNKKALLIFSIFLIPSVMFWTAMASKEVITFLFLGLFFWSFLKVSNKVLSAYLFLLLASILLLMSIKIYIKISFLILLLFLFIQKIKLIKKPAITFFIITVVLCLLTFGLNHFEASINPLEILKKKRIGFVEWMAMDGVFEQNKSTFQMLPFKDDIFSLALLFIEGLFNILFRPLIWDCYNVATVISSLESVLFFSLLVYAVLNRKKTLLYEEKFWLYGLLLFTIISSAIVGMTVPNAGALVRYKSVIIPFIAIICVIIVDENKMPNFIKKIT